MIQTFRDLGESTEDSDLDDVSDEDGGKRDRIHSCASDGNLSDETPKKRLRSPLVVRKTAADRSLHLGEKVEEAWSADSYFSEGCEAGRDELQVFVQ